MKIIYLASSPIPSQRANSIQVVRMCQALAQEGHDLTLVVPHIQQKSRSQSLPSAADVFALYNVSGFDIHWLPVWDVPNKPLFLLPQLWHLFNQIKPDMVYGRFLLGCLLAARRGYPTIFEAHSPVWEISRIEERAYLWFMQAPASIGCVCISDKLRQMYLTHFGNNADKYFVAHDAADIPATQIKPIMNDQERPLAAGYVGSFSAGKGVEIVMKLASRIPNIHFILAGGTPDQIEKQKKQATDNVVFLGYITPDQIDQAYDQFDIALLPNQKNMLTYGQGLDISEYNSPLKLFEYMAHRKGIISSDIPVLREVLHSENAILVQPDHIDDWVVALNQMAQQKMRERLSTRAHQDFLQHYTWQSRAKMILSLKNTGTSK